MKKFKINPVDCLYWAGAVFISFGLGFWSRPAGLVAFGAFLLAASVLADFSGGGKT